MGPSLVDSTRSSSRGLDLYWGEGAFGPFQFKQLLLGPSLVDSAKSSSCGLDLSWGERVFGLFQIKQLLLGLQLKCKLLAQVFIRFNRLGSKRTTFDYNFYHKSNDFKPLAARSWIGPVSITSLIRNLMNLDPGRPKLDRASFYYKFN